MASVIVIGTTPTIRFNNFQTVSPNDFRVADLTIKVAGQILIERNIDTATITDTEINWTLTQEETLLIGTRSGRIMLNWVTNSGTRGVGKTETFVGGNNDKREVL